MEETCQTGVPTSDKRIKRVLYSALAWLLAVCIILQIVLGTVWMIRNIDHVLNFGDTVEYLELSKTLTPDEYRPIVYPLLLRGLSDVEAWTRIPMTYALYSLQTIISLMSLLFFFTSFFRVLNERRVLVLKPAVRRAAVAVFSAYLLTTPIIAEFNFAILTDSLATSFLLIMLTLIINLACLGQGRWYHFAAIYFCALIQSLLRPERFYLCIAALLVFVLWGWWMQKRGGAADTSKKTFWKKAAGFAAVILLLCVSVPVMNASTQTPGAQGRPKASVAAMLAARVVWGHFAECYGDFNDEVHAILTYEQAQEIDSHNNNIGLIATPLIQSQVGDRVDDIYLHMTTVALRKIPDKVVMSILEDCCTFFAVPYQLAAGLNDLVPTATVWNYTRMAEAHPLYTSLYFRFSVYSQFFLFGLAFVFGLCKRNSLLRKSLAQTVPLVIASLFITVGFGVCASAPPNYRYVLLPCIMWLTWFLTAWCSFMPPWLRPMLLDSAASLNNAEKQDNVN